VVDRLYQFGCTIAAAREQTSRIADRILDYIVILDILGALFENNSMLITAKARRMFERLRNQSDVLLMEIEALLPKQHTVSGQEKLRFKDRIAWNFRKPKASLLLAQIEYVKSNVNLLVNTILLGRKIRDRTRRKNNTRLEHDQDYQEKSGRANNAVVQHLNASDRLSQRERDLEASDAASAAAGNTSNALTVTSSNNAVIMLSTQVESIVRFQNAMHQLHDPGQRQAFIMENSPNLLRELVVEMVEQDVQVMSDADLPKGIGNDFNPDDTTEERNLKSENAGNRQPTRRVAKSSSDPEHARPSTSIALDPDADPGEHSSRLRSSRSDSYSQHCPYVDSDSDESRYKWDCWERHATHGRNTPRLAPSSKVSDFPVFLDRGPNDVYGVGNTFMNLGPTPQRRDIIQAMKEAEVTPKYFQLRAESSEPSEPSRRKKEKKQKEREQQEWLINAALERMM
jgi:hypothetical protein